MSSYTPTKISGNSCGLVESREEFLLPDDAYPVLENAYVWRERIRRKQGYELLGRLRRKFAAVSIGNSSASPWTFNLLTRSPTGLGGVITAATQANPGQITSTNHGLSTGQVITISGVVGMVELNGHPYTITKVDANNFTIGVDSSGYTAYVSGGIWVNLAQPNAQIQPGSVVIVMGGVTFTDQGSGTLTSVTPGNSGTINYQTSVMVLTTTVAGGTPATATFNYFPNLPVMGLRNRDLNATNNQLTIAFDTTYAYIFASGGWQEYIPGTVWTGSNSNFFWHTNYWVDNSNLKLFWVTNFSGTSGDPIRYNNGAAWTNFAPTINMGRDVLAQCLCILPYRSRLVVFNTYEGTSLAASINYPQRIRWSAIGSPLYDANPAVAPQPWRDDVRGQGGFIDIPTNEVLVSVGFVRDNIVIYCSRSTWQLRYTGRTISPFQLEKVNSELGAEATFSVVQFNETLVGVGDKGIVQCDSYKSERIDIKIPDLVFQFNDENSSTNVGTERVQSVRDFVNRLTFWTYPYQSGVPYRIIYPNRRLLYNYENDSWAIFTDSLTALGTFYPTSGRSWTNTQIPWERANFPWNNRQLATPSIIGGNQQGFVEYLDTQVSNDVSLYIAGITGNTTTPTSINVPNHNLVDGQVIQISSITSTGYSSLNNGIFGVTVVDQNNLLLWLYNSSSGEFTTPQLNASATYNGGGIIAIRDGFYIQSKKFNFIDQGQSIQVGYIDILMSSTNAGAITLNTFVNYNETEASNVEPQNDDPDTNLPNTFFNSVINTSNPDSDGVEGTKYWQRVYCPTRGNFITLAYTLSNAQLIGVEQESNVEIDAQIVWNRPAGRMTNK